MPLNADKKRVSRKFDGIDDATIFRLAADHQSFLLQRGEELRAEVIAMRHADFYFGSTIQFGKMRPWMDLDLMRAQAVHGRSISVAKPFEDQSLRRRIDLFQI